jgi:hypothetical protein
MDVSFIRSPAQAHPAGVVTATIPFHSFLGGIFVLEEPSVVEGGLLVK